MDPACRAASHPGVHRLYSSRPDVLRQAPRMTMTMLMMNESVGVDAMIAWGHMACTGTCFLNNLGTYHSVSWWCLYIRGQ